MSFILITKVRRSCLAYNSEYNSMGTDAATPHYNHRGLIAMRREGVSQSRRQFDYAVSL